MRAAAGTRNQITAMSSATIGSQSPHRTYPVVAVDVRIGSRRMPGWNSPVRAITRPWVSTNAETPDTAASTIHRPVSTARIRLIWRC
jgi:hypothetical protein